MYKHLIAVTALGGLIASLSSNAVQADERDESKTRSSLGLAVFEDVDSRRIVVDRVIPDGPADRGGLREGDVILKVDDLEISDGHGILETLVKRKPGETITFRVKRDGDLKTVKVTLAERQRSHARDREDDFSCEEFPERFYRRGYYSGMDDIRDRELAERFYRRGYYSGMDDTRDRELAERFYRRSYYGEMDDIGDRELTERFYRRGYYGGMDDVKDREMALVPVDELAQTRRVLPISRRNEVIVVKILPDSFMERLRLLSEDLLIRLARRNVRETRIIDREERPIAPREKVRIRPPNNQEKDSSRLKEKETQVEVTHYGAQSPSTQKPEAEHVVDRVDRICTRLDSLDRRVRMMEQEIDEVFKLLKK